MKNPLLDYFGGKWRIANRLIDIFPEHKSFVDPMCGAGSILFKKQPSKNEIINDKHNEIVNLFHVLRENRKELEDKLKLTPYSRSEYETARVASVDTIEQARRTMVKAWFGIGDSIDRKTGFKVSLTKHGASTGAWVSLVDFIGLYAERLRPVIIENLDYIEVIKRYDKIDTFFYLDPPYVLSTRSRKHAYRHDWNDDDQHKFIEVVGKLSGKAMISGYDSEIYRKLGWNRKEFSSRSQKKKTTEVVWMNY